MVHHSLKAPKIHRGRYLPTLFGPPTLPSPKNKALGEILTISCLVSLPSELHDHWNCLIKTASRGSFPVVIFFLAFCLFESTTRHRSDIVAVSLNRVCGMRNDDVWCVDTRGVLTMCVCKETYEKLGLVGQRMPFKNWSGERYGMCDIDVCLSAALQFLY